MILHFMDRKGICMIIDADFQTETVKIENCTDDNLHRAFGVKENPSWADFEFLLEDRCFPRTRDKLKLVLKDVGGAALFSDTRISYDLGLPLETCYGRIEAKPFNCSFDEQMDVAEELYGVHFYYWFTEKDVERLLSDAKEVYGTEIVNRVLAVMRQQMRKYAYFKKEPPSL